MPDFRQATLGDLQDISRVWNAAAGEAFPLSPGIILARTEGDPDFSWEYSRVAQRDGSIIGFCLATRSALGAPRPQGWQDKGWVKLMAVDPGWQRQGIGGQLLRQAEEALCAGGGIACIAAGTDPFHLFPGPPDDLPGSQPFFAKHGYEVGANGPWDMMRDIGDYRVPDRVEALLGGLAPDIRIINATREHTQGICEFLAREFPGGWYYYSRLYLGADCDPKEFVILLDGESVEGFCHTSHYRCRHVQPNTLWRLALGERYGGLGPIGVSAHLRGRGLGLALLCKSVEYLQGLGVRNMCIDWTGLVDFYGKIGFKPWKHYRHAVKTMP